jgi:hypothetical protein
MNALSFAAGVLTGLLASFGLVLGGFLLYVAILFWPPP